MTRKYTGLVREEAGFSLVEMMVTVAIAGIFFAAITSAFVAQDKGYQVRNEITDMMQNARLTMDMMSRELRQAQGFSNIASDTISFDANVDGNGAKTVVYSTYTSNGVPVVGRKLGAGTKQPMAFNVKSLVFNYYKYDAAYPSTGHMDPLMSAANAADVKVVEIVLTMQTANKDPNYALNNGYRTYTLSSYVTPRNINFN